MARKSRKVDFVNVGKQEADITSVVTPKRVYHAGLYARLSLESEANRERNTIETQMELLKKYVDNTDDIVVEKEYFDISKTGRTFERDGFDEMMQDVRSGLIDCIIVKDLSRLGRNYVDAGTYVERVFPFFEVRFISVAEAYDSEKKDVDISVRLTNIINEFYSRDLAKKVKASFRANWDQGKCVAGSIAYGLKKSEQDKHQLIVDKEVSMNIVMIFDMFLEGKTYAEIVHYLNGHKVLCPKAYKTLQSKGFLPEGVSMNWRISTVKRILQNRYYTGDSVHGHVVQSTVDGKRKFKRTPKEEWIITENTHEAIVSRETFFQAQEEIERREKITKSPKNPGMYKTSDKNMFKDKIFCGDCGKTMYLKKNGTSMIYVCSSHLIRKSCSSHTVEAETIYDQVLRVIHTHMNVYIDKVDMIQRMNTRQENIMKYDVFGKELRKLNRELKQLYNNKERLYEDYVSRLIDAEQYETFKAEDAIREKEMKEQIDELSIHMAGYAKVFRTDKEWAKAIDCYRDKRKLTKKMCDAFLEKVEVFQDGNIKVHLYYDDMLTELVKYSKEREAETNEK